MPINVFTNKIKIKNEDGEYIGVDALTDDTTEQRIADVNATGTANMAALNARGTELKNVIISPTRITNDSGLGIIVENGAATASSAQMEEVKTAAKAGAADWLTEHISSGYAVDDTLSISGAAADAKKTGDEITDLKSEIRVAANGSGSIDLTLYNDTVVPYTINSSNATVKSGANYSSYQVPRSLAWNKLDVTTNSSKKCSVVFLKTQLASTLVNGTDVSSALATGETGRHEIDISTTATLDIPATCTYIIIFKMSNGGDATPSSVITYSKLDERIDKIDECYNLYPTGDSTSRATEILNILNTYGECRLAPGEYYFSRFKMPAGTALIGAGKTLTRLITGTSTSNAYAIRMDVNCKISNLSLEYDTESDITPTSSYENILNGIQIGSTDSTDDGAYNANVENVEVKNFAGCGVFLRRIGSGNNGSAIRNVKVSYCGVGFYLGNQSEYNIISGCYARRCYTGLIVIGGNNIVSDCVFSECENGVFLIKTDSYGTASNEAHGTIDSCKITHVGYYNNAGLSVKSEAQSNGEIISNCMLTSDIYVKDRGKGLSFIGCHFRSGTNNITIDNSIVSMMSCMFVVGSDTGITVSNNGLLKRVGCLDYDGNLLSDVS